LCASFIGGNIAVVFSCSRTVIYVSPLVSSDASRYMKSSIT